MTKSILSACGLFVDVHFHGFIIAIGILLTCISLNGINCAPASDDSQGAVCRNKVKNRYETDVDCGGSCAVIGKLCNNNKSCNLGCDCKSGVCINKRCAAPTCSDLVQNQGEAGIDCGAVCGINQKCGTNSYCNSSNDCISGVCTNNICAAPTCNDHIQNQGEAGVDCGAVCGINQKCGTNSYCNSAGDCISGVCTNNICADSCTSCTFNDHRSLYNYNDTVFAGAFGGAGGYSLLRVSNSSSSNVLGFFVDDASCSNICAAANLSCSIIDNVEDCIGFDSYGVTRSANNIIAILNVLGLATANAASPNPAAANITANAAAAAHFYFSVCEALPGYNYCCCRSNVP